jgi:hypothetical protein
MTIFKLNEPTQSSWLAVFGGRGMSFNICRGTLGSLAMFTAIRNASSRVKEGLAAVRLVIGAGTGVPPDWRINNAEIECINDAWRQSSLAIEHHIQVRSFHSCLL